MPGSLMDYAHGFLGEPETARLREHVSGCPDCRKALGRIEEERELFRAAAAQFDGLQRKPTRPADTRPRWDFQAGRVLTMAAAILLCAGVSWMLLHPPDHIPEVASKAKELLALQEELPPGLLRARPGIADRLAGGADHVWTQEFLDATEFSDQGIPKIPALRKEDVSALVRRAFRGARNPQEQTAVADRTEQWGLRLTQFVSAEEALQRVHSWVDVENMLLQDLLGQILTKHGVSYVIDGTAHKEGNQGVVSMKTFDIPAASNLSLLLVPRRMDFTTLGSLVVITRTGQAWKPNGRDAVLPTAEETRNVDLWLKDLVSSDAAKQQKATEDLVTLGPAALGPLMAALGPLEGKAAVRIRNICRKIAWDNNNLWLVDLPSGADLQTLSGSQKKILETRITCEKGGMELEEYLKSLGLKCGMKAEPQAPLSASVKDEPLSLLLKAVTRPEGLDFYLEGETIVIDTADNVRAVVER